MRAGYACITLGEEGLRCQRTTVLRHATPEKLRSLIRENIDGLHKILRYNEECGYRLFRIGNDFIPFASHPTNTLRWWEEFAWHLRGVGKWVREHGHRLSFHASHFAVLNSTREEVVESSLQDITYLGRVLEAMELSAEHKIILHAGITTPTLEEAEARFERALERVPAEFRRHLAIENDDRYFPAERLIPLAHRTGLPVVVDVFHHTCLPGTWAEMPCAELLRRVFETWKPEDGPPKVHFSSQDPEKRPGAHGYWIAGDELERFLEHSAALPTDFDIMFESKGKDLSLVEMMPILRADPRFRPLARAA